MFDFSQPIHSMDNALPWECEVCKARVESVWEPNKLRYEPSSKYWDTWDDVVFCSAECTSKYVEAKRSKF